jgi:uncharacterized membrane-anchored protein YhcB (DUF1043 family)
MKSLLIGTVIGTAIGALGMHLYMAKKNATLKMQIEELIKENEKRFSKDEVSDIMSFF